ncbi:MAG: FHA domain-containing protein [Planctomycetota bacterium]|nr:FHA domain-containing protein [Planctomycetota bacterium]
MFFDKIRRKKADQENSHSLTRVGGEPIALTPGQSFLMGRSNEAELTIPSQRVSRKHTEIFWQDKAPWIRDCGSQNGTKVNGKRIKGDVQLQDQDELEIGPFLCTYRAISPTTDLEGSGIDDGALTAPMLSDTLAGSFAQMSAFEVLQTLEFNQKTGTLEVFGDDEDSILVVRSGRPIWAKTGDVEGNEALLTMLSWTSGQFNFSSTITHDGQNVQGSITNLLFEAGRRMDEGQRS